MREVKDESGKGEKRKSGLVNEKEDEKESEGRMWKSGEE